MKYLRIGLILIILSAVLAFATPAYADMANPDTPPEIIAINVYRNLLQTGDRLFLIYVNIPYATEPDLPVTQAFIWRLFAMDGTTEKGSTVGYAFKDGGYGYNLYSMYFDNTTGVTWNLEYPLRLYGNPLVFDTPPTYNFTVPTSAYSTLSDTDDEQAELAARILDIAIDLDSRWGLSVDYSLLSQMGGSTVLSVYGEAFFRGAIYGLQAMAPGVFCFIIGDVTAGDRDWELAYSENLTDQWSGTWVETAREAGASLFSLDYDLASIILLLGLCVGVIVANVQLTGDAWNGMIDASVVLILGARLGMYPMGFLGLFAALCVIFIGIKLWGLPRG